MEKILGMLCYVYFPEELTLWQHCCGKLKACMNRETRKMHNRAEARNVCNSKEICSTSFTYRRETRVRKIARGTLEHKSMGKE